MTPAGVTIRVLHAGSVCPVVAVTAAVITIVANHDNMRSLRSLTTRIR
jgi:hypothetical protein